MLHVFDPSANLFPAIAAFVERGPCLADGSNTIDGATYMAHVQIYGGLKGTSVFPYIALPDSDSLQTLVTDKTYDRMN